MHFIVVEVEEGAQLLRRSVILIGVNSAAGEKLQATDWRLKPRDYISQSSLTRKELVVRYLTFVNVLKTNNNTLIGLDIISIRFKT